MRRLLPACPQGWDLYDTAPGQCYGFPFPPLRRYDLWQLSSLQLAGDNACLNERLRPTFCQKVSGGQQATNTRDVTSTQPSREWPT